MRVLAVVAAFMGAALAAPSSQAISIDSRDGTTKNGFTLARPGGVKDLTISKDNTINGTYHSDKTQTVEPNKFADATAATLAVSLVNSLADEGVKAYIQGTDSDNKVVFVTGAGLVYPSSGGSTTPVAISDPIAIDLGAQGSITNVTLPISIISGRVYFCVGDLPFYMVSGGASDTLVQPSVTNPSDPSAGLRWGFVEFTLTDTNEIYTNISYVDFVGLILSIDMQNTDGTSAQTIGLAPDALEKVCNDLRTQGSTDGLPWAAMCIAASDGTPLRALSPQDYSSVDNAGFANYWSDYVNQVWTTYSTTPLVMNTQTDAGNVNCLTSGDSMTCDGDSIPFAKPTADDIWGCNTGPFAKIDGENGIHTAIRARLCAAFTRSTLLLDGGSTQPSLPATSYYTVSPTSHYARILHQYYVDGRGYAFSYDDVNPDGDENASGTIHSVNPQLLSVFVGGISG